MAESSTFAIQIIAPEAAFYEGESDFLEFTSVTGEMGVYRDHIPLTTILAPCTLRIHLKNDVKKVKVSGGFVEIQKEKITVLAEDAAWEE